MNLEQRPPSLRRVTVPTAPRNRSEPTSQSAPASDSIKERPTGKSAPQFRRVLQRTACAVNGRWRDTEFASRGSSLVRTLVVACATLAILFVCFSMYQFTQSWPGGAVEKRTPRLPSLLSEPTGVPWVDPTDAPSASLGDGATVGPGRDIRLTIFPREGVQARLEVEVRDWTPVPGASNHFRLIDPIIRLRTRDGHAVRVSAGEGLLEAERRTGGSLDPSRGSLTKGVVVEYDRIPERERTALPPPRNTQPEPDELVRVETDGVEFDLEYGRLTAAGEVRLLARDANLTASDFEARFGEHADRLESLRIARGGRIELSPDSADFGRHIPGMQRGGLGGGERQTVSQWLWKTFQQRLHLGVGEGAAISNASTTEAGDRGATVARSRPATETGSPPPPSSPGDHDPRSANAPSNASSSAAAKGVTLSADGIPVFHAGSSQPSTNTKPSAQYHAMFRTQVTVEQKNGDETLSSLLADELEITRPFRAADQPIANVARHGASDRDTAALPPSPTTATRSAAPASATEPDAKDTGTGSRIAAAEPAGASAANLSSTTSRIVVTWMDQLVVEALSPDDARWSGAEATSLTATGAPVRLRTREADATCRKLTYEPDDARVTFAGDETAPVSLNTESQGALTSIGVTVHRTRDRFTLQATGPGELRPRPASTPPNAAVIEARGADPASPTVRFADGMEVDGRLESVTRVDLSGHVVTEDVQRIEQATFRGSTKVQQDDFSLASDALQLGFGMRRGWWGPKTTLESLIASGHSVLSRANDRLACDELRANMEVEPDGRTLPRVVTARGNIVANEGARSISASDELVVELALTESITDSGAIPSPNGSAAADPSRGPRLAARRLRASGHVEVEDPELEVRASELDCALDANQQISRATVIGTSEESAMIRNEGFSVTGRQIDWYGADQRAEVAGEGRFTMRSANDLNGRRSRHEEGVPVAITWTERMRYVGRENQAVFLGRVHATSAETSTFDCDRLTVDFERASDGAWSPESSAPSEPRIRGVRDVFHRVAAAAKSLTGDDRAADAAPGAADSSLAFRVGESGPRRRIESILASGNAVAVVTEFDSSTDRMRSRARLSGPRLSVHLRPEVQKMRIEGPGDLLIEDFQEAQSAPATPKRGFFSLGDGDGPSKTLIRWKDSMQYDFSLNQTRFEGDAELKFVSGGELDKLFQRSSVAARSGGRFTYLKCDSLTADFLGREAPRRSRDDDRIGRLSASDLRQFEATGAVELQDETEGLSILADRVVFERARRILSINADGPRKARLVKQQPGQLPYQVTVNRLVYNLGTGQVELSQPTGLGH